MGKEKKEIGKLLELLNEYCMGAFVYDNDILRFRLGDRAKIEGNAILISKSFGFIKWLVENDKIGTSKANDKNLNGYEIELRIRAVKELVADSEEKTVLYLNLLMLLAISNSPIDDLISYLK